MHATRAPEEAVSDDKFEKDFTFTENTCANKYLSDFWATTGTFITALLSAGLFRTSLEHFMRNVFEHVSGSRPVNAVKGAEPGAHELHIVKTAHLGLCQATGALMCGMYSYKLDTYMT